MRTRTLLLAATLTTGLLTALPATAASAAPARFADDFNGDGYRDLVTAAPSATVGGKTGAGAVVVNYGSKSGISASRHTVVTQNTAGVPGTAEHGDMFGSSLATGDLDRDGYADLVIGAPGEDVGSDDGGGTVVIVWGGKNGLSGARTVPDPAASAHDAYGQSLATGDLDGDGRADLAVGSTGTDVWIHRGGFTRAAGAASRNRLTTGLQSGSGHGAHALATGDLDHDGTDDLVISGRYHPDRTTLFDGTLVYLGSPSGLTFQTALRSFSDRTAAVGDITGDGYDDVVTSAFPDAHRDGDGGSVSLYTGGPDGVSTTALQTLDQDTPGVPGTAESDDDFGWAVSLGDVDGDGYTDAAVSAFYESIGPADRTGSVTVLRGTPTGLTGTGARSFSQATTGVPGTAEDDDHFGSAVRLADLDGDGRADLSVGAPGENGGDGAVWSLRGSGSGVRTTGALSFGPSALGVSTSGFPRLGTLMGQ